MVGDAEWMESSRATFTSNLSSHGAASPIPQPPTWLLADQYSSRPLISHYCGGANSPGTGGRGCGEWERGVRRGEGGKWSHQQSDAPGLGV